MSTTICCGCEYEGPDRSQCGVWNGHPGACRCDCHAATWNSVSLNRSEVAEAIAECRHLGLITADNETSVSSVLCQRWGIDR